MGWKTKAESEGSDLKKKNLWKEKQGEERCGGLGTAGVEEEEEDGEAG